MLKKCLVISLLMTFVVDYSFAQFTDKELQKIDLKLRNYTILSQENILLQEKIKVLDWQVKEYEKVLKKENSWYERNKFVIGFGVGCLFSFSSVYLAILTINGK